MKSILSIVLLFVLCGSFFSCGKSVTPIPKPRGQLRIDKALPEGYVQAKISGQSLWIAKSAQFFLLSEEGFEIYYPAFHARWFGHLISLNPKIQDDSFTESRQMIYRNVRSIDQIQAAYFTNREGKVYALFYNLGAESATPFQFEVTDSTSKLLRGALYFDAPIQSDSIAPVLDYLREDIVYMLEHFQWNN